MARTRTLTLLIADVRQRCDMVNDLTFVTDAEITEYLNQSGTEFRDLLVQARGEDYFETTNSITTVAGTTTYTLPSDFYQLNAVTAAISGETITLRKFERNEMGHFNTQQTPGGLAITLYYIPYMARLTTGSETLDGLNGLEEYIIVDACIKCLAKEESDVSVFAAQKAAMAQRITKMVSERDAGQPAKIQRSARGRGWRLPFYQPAPVYRLQAGNIQILYGDPPWGW